MSEPSRRPRYISEIRERFKDEGIEPDDFYPISTWFSYGSNLCREDFERKMRDYGSYLSLARARPARLTGWERRLDNESSTRGLAYSIRNDKGKSLVDGIVHDVPIGDLPAFLRFEGVLDENYQLKNDEERRYDIKMVTARLLRSDDSQESFVLVGRCAIADEKLRSMRAKKYEKKLVKYIRTSIKGAVDFGIDISRFEDDLKWVEGLR